VETAVDGPEGLGRFRAGGPWGLVILDHRMPGMDGEEVLRRLRLDDPAVPVLIVTAYGSLDAARDALRSGASGFLLKPMSPDELRSTVAETLATHAPPAAGGDPPGARGGGA
jgi:two-component system repressor protein LuxO